MSAPPPGMPAVADPDSDPTDLLAALAWLHHLATDPYVCNISTVDRTRLTTVLGEYDRMRAELDRIVQYEDDGLVDCGRADDDALCEWPCKSCTPYTGIGA